MRFELFIESHNEAMRTNQQVADALLAVAFNVRAGWVEHGIKDTNGNTVGNWRLIRDTPARVES